MGYFIHILLLIAAIKLWYVSKNEWLCAGIYTVPRMILFLLIGVPALRIVFGSVVIFVWLYVYFRVQDRIRDGFIRWLFFCGGIVVTIVLSIYI